MMYTVFLIPILIVVVGFLLFKFPPSKPNWFIGYRTNKSMKDEKAWKEANNYCGKLFLIVGLFELFLSIVLLVLNYLSISFSDTILSIIVIVQLIPMLITVVLVEKKISK